MRKVSLGIGIGLYILAAMSAHAIDFIKPFVPEYKQVGQGTFKVTVMKVYDAFLYAPNGVWRADSPFALQLVYALNLSGNRIADSTITQMQKQGATDTLQLDNWRLQMVDIFPDVTKGMSLTGVYTATGKTVFFQDNKHIGTITEPAFGKRFFHIWLGQNTTAPKLRKKLLGEQ